MENKKIKRRRRIRGMGRGRGRNYQYHSKTEMIDPWKRFQRKAFDITIPT